MGEPSDHPGAQASAGKCGRPAVSRDGKPCQNEAGKRTDHPGVGPCWLHGGANLDEAETAEKVAAYREQRLNRVHGRDKTPALHARSDLDVIMGRPLQINPVDAMIWCIRITAGEVQWLTEQIHTKVTDDTLVEVNKFDDTKLNVWVRERQLAMDRLVRYSESAIKLGIAERQVQLAEQYGTMLVKLIRGILDGIHLSPSQVELAQKVVRRELVAAAYPDSQYLDNIHPMNGKEAATLQPTVIEGEAVPIGGAGKHETRDSPPRDQRSQRAKKRFRDGDRRSRQGVGI